MLLSFLSLWSASSQCFSPLCWQRAAVANVSSEMESANKLMEGAKDVPASLSFLLLQLYTSSCYVLIVKLWPWLNPKKLLVIVRKPYVLAYKFPLEQSSPLISSRCFALFCTLPPSPPPQDIKVNQYSQCDNDMLKCKNVKITNLWFKMPT